MEKLHVVPSNTSISADKTRISVLGATGSIGMQTLDMVDHDMFDVVALTGGENITLLAKLARKFNPEVVATANPSLHRELREMLNGTSIKVLSGTNGVMEAASREVDLCMSAISGFAGIDFTVKAAQQGITIALANKESVVCGGRHFIDYVHSHGSKLIPVDSEHSALLRILPTCEAAVQDIRKVVITASGGPFHQWSAEKLLTVTPEDALQHPVWAMGKKITIDSATLMNKALELIEAVHLFSLSPDDIEILIHPQAVVHALVEYKDGASFAQMSMPDMHIPIRYALFGCKIKQSECGVDLTKLRKLEFYRPRNDICCAINIARYALQYGGGGCVMNAANEIAVEAFLIGAIDFLSIAPLVSEAVEFFDGVEFPGIDNLSALDSEVRHHCRSMLKKRRIAS